MKSLSLLKATNVVSLLLMLFSPKLNSFGDWAKLFFGSIILICVYLINKIEPIPQLKQLPFILFFALTILGGVAYYLFV